MSSPAPGWYPDPREVGALRWWDGAGWGAQYSGEAGVASTPVDEVAGAGGSSSARSSDIVLGAAVARPVDMAPRGSVASETVLGGASARPSDTVLGGTKPRAVVGGSTSRGGAGALETPPAFPPCFVEKLSIVWWPRTVAGLVLLGSFVGGWILVQRATHATDLESLVHLSQERLLLSTAALGIMLVLLGISHLKRRALQQVSVRTRAAGVDAVVFSGAVTSVGDGGPMSSVGTLTMDRYHATFQPDGPGEVVDFPWGTTERVMLRQDPTERHQGILVLTARSGYTWQCYVGGSTYPTLAYVLAGLKSRAGR